MVGLMPRMCVSAPAFTAASCLLQTSDKAVLEVIADVDLPDDARVEQIVERLVSPGAVRIAGLEMEGEDLPL